MPKPARDLTNQRFGKLIAIRPNGQLQGRAAWLCKCDCGKELTIRATSLLANYTTSCGCYRDQVATKNIYMAALKHGQSGRKGEFAKEYSTWAHMIQRCYDKNCPEYKSYGEVGIGVCDIWRFGGNGKTAFEHFIDNMGKAPTQDHTIDRYPNNSGNYEPANCRWATRKEQAQNTKRNIWLTLNGKTMIVEEWSREIGIDSNTLRKRVHSGWTDEEVLTLPINLRKSPGRPKKSS